jgi:hypothetical protein
LWGCGVGVGDCEQGCGFEDALGCGVVGVFGDAVVCFDVVFVLFMANSRIVTL